MDEAGVWLLVSVAGFLSAWGLIFFVNLLRAPWMLSKEKQKKISELEIALEAKRIRTKSSDWKELRQRFERVQVPDLCASYTEGRDIATGWQLSGGTFNRKTFESTARMAGQRVSLSRYCRRTLNPKIFEQPDPVDVWLWTVREMTNSFRAELHGPSGSIGSIREIERESVSLCWELESLEDNS